MCVVCLIAHGTTALSVPVICASFVPRCVCFRHNATYAQSSVPCDQHMLPVAYVPGHRCSVPHHMCCVPFHMLQVCAYVRHFTRRASSSGLPPCLALRRLPHGDRPTARPALGLCRRDCGSWGCRVTRLSPSQALCSLHSRPGLPAHHPHDARVSPITEHDRTPMLKTPTSK